MQEALLFLAVIMLFFLLVCTCQMYQRAKWELLDGNKGKRPMPMAPYDRDVFFIVWWVMISKIWTNKLCLIHEGVPLFLIHLLPSFMYNFITGEGVTRKYYCQRTLRLHKNSIETYISRESVKMQYISSQGNWDEEDTVTYFCLSCYGETGWKQQLNDPWQRICILVICLLFVSSRNRHETWEQSWEQSTQTETWQNSGKQGLGHLSIKTGVHTMHLSWFKNVSDLLLRRDMSRKEFLE